MYKYLLCWRYLRTRYIALASIISVMLGVATMIVVNSVMAGFSDKMRERLHGILADVVVEAHSIDGFYDWKEVMARIKEAAGDEVVAMAPTMETFGLLKFSIGDETITRQVQLIGVRPEDRANTGDFGKFLFGEKPDEKIPASFAVPDALRARTPAGDLLEDLPKDDPFYKEVHNQLKDQSPEFGMIVGYAIATMHRAGTKSDDFLIPQGKKVGIVYPKASKMPEPGYDNYTVVGYFKSGMSEYDSTHVYVPLERFQKMRLLVDPQGRGAVNQIQVKLKKGANLDDVALKIQMALERLRPMHFRVLTWEQKQGPLLSAVTIEQNILNMLLFFIIAVAGFGILAIFSMIVVEKTRDIGVMKALGASTAGVRAIFLGYGLLLGAVGSGVGMAGGLLFVHNINWIEDQLSWILGHKVFDDTIYYFNEIPTLVEPMTVVGVVGGALFIAAMASVWPAQRAAKLHPVRALRFE
ncbi:MAG: ABC transporter permease [Isosphaeraceae bacterium]|nr:ABC transporter permease [Isosphaeraceae bacterium]